MLVIEIIAMVLVVLGALFLAGAPPVLSWFGSEFRKWNWVSIVGAISTIVSLVVSVFVLVIHNKEADEYTSQADEKRIEIINGIKNMEDYYKNISTIRLLEQASEFFEVSVYDKSIWDKIVDGEFNSRILNDLEEVETNSLGIENQNNQFVKVKLKKDKDPSDVLMQKWCLDEIKRRIGPIWFVDLSNGNTDGSILTMFMKNFEFRLLKVGLKFQKQGDCFDQFVDSKSFESLQFVFLDYPEESRFDSWDWCYVQQFWHPKSKVVFVRLTNKAHNEYAKWLKTRPEKLKKRTIIKESETWPDREYTWTSSRVTSSNDEANDKLATWRKNQKIIKPRQ